MLKWVPQHHLVEQEVLGGESVVTTTGDVLVVVVVSVGVVLEAVVADEVVVATVGDEVPESVPDIYILTDNSDGDGGRS